MIFLLLILQIGRSCGYAFLCTLCLLAKEICVSEHMQNWQTGKAVLLICLNVGRVVM